MSFESTTGLEASPSHARGHIWFLFSGIFSMILGAFAIAIPCVTTVVIAKVVGIILLASGIDLLVTAVFSKAREA